MNISDTVTRISQLQYQLASLTTAFVPQASATAGTSTAASTPASTGSTSFADALSAATAAAATPASAATTLATTSIDAPTGATLSAATAATGGGSLSATAASGLTSGQRQFATRLAADTGLNSNVVAAWMLAEESGGAAQSRQAANNNDWLNIGYTDSATYGSRDSVWSDPVAAADATAGWLKGQNTIPGYGTASAGIRGILSTTDQGPAAQIAALQNSGWASSGYPDLPALYQQVTI